MNSAAISCLLIGLFLLVLYGSLALRPEALLPALRKFPRTVWPGRILTAVCLLWFARNLTQVDLGGFNGLKRLLYVAVPVGIYLVITFIPDLLSVRGLCILFLLGAQPLLVATRWTGTPASPAVGIFTYAVIVKSMVLVVYPHFWIRGVDWWQAHPASRLPGVAAGGMVSVAMIAAGIVSL